MVSSEVITGEEGRGKHCSSHCRHQQTQMKVMSSHYLTGPFGMKISQSLLMTSKTQIPTLALPHRAFYLSHCGRYHTLENRSHSQHLCFSPQCNNPLQNRLSRPCSPSMGHKTYVLPLVGWSWRLQWSLVMFSVSAHSSSGCNSTPRKLFRFSCKTQLI